MPTYPIAAPFGSALPLGTYEGLAANSELTCILAFNDGPDSYIVAFFVEPSSTNSFFPRKMMGVLIDVAGGPPSSASSPGLVYDGIDAFDGNSWAPGPALPYAGISGDVPAVVLTNLAGQTMAVKIPTASGSGFGPPVGVGSPIFPDVTTFIAARAFLRTASGGLCAFLGKSFAGDMEVCAYQIDTVAGFGTEVVTRQTFSTGGLGFGRNATVVSDEVFIVTLLDGSSNVWAIPVQIDSGLVVTVGTATMLTGPGWEIVPNTHVDPTAATPGAFYMRSGAFVQPFAVDLTMLAITPGSVSDYQIDCHSGALGDLLGLTPSTVFADAFGLFTSVGAGEVVSGTPTMGPYAAALGFPMGTSPLNGFLYTVNEINGALATAQCWAASLGTLPPCPAGGGWALGHVAY